MPTSFHNQTVIVTGASSGIGACTALAFAQAGANIVLAARSRQRLEEFAAAHPKHQHQFHIVPADVTSDTDVQSLVSATIERFGRIDILVNNAGFGMRATVEELDFSDAHQLMETNFFGTLRCTRAVLPHMRRQGRGQIVNIGSILSLIATPNNSIYSASKFAVRAFSDSLRLELKGTGIDVILIMPGYTDTPFFDNMVRYGGPSRIHKHIKAQSPDKVAAAIVQACRHRRREVVLTMPAKLGAIAKRLWPGLVDFSLSRMKQF
jgi:short-subunit dehydrogenase